MMDATVDFLPFCRVLPSQALTRRPWCQRPAASYRAWQRGQRQAAPECQFAVGNRLYYSLQNRLFRIRASKMPRKKRNQVEEQKPASHDRSHLPKSAESVFREFFPGGFTTRDEANAIVAFAFRNGPIEDLHAGKYSELLEDKNLSRITDTEMKTLMLNACQKVEELLRLKEANPDEYCTFLASYNWRYCRQWER